MNTSNWTKFSDRYPKDSDFDKNNNIIVLFNDGCYEILNRDYCLTGSIVAWASLPNAIEVTRDDIDFNTFNKFIKTYGLNSSMVSSLNLQLAYEAGLREARKQAREALDKVDILFREGSEEAAEAFRASIQA